MLNGNCCTAISFAPVCSAIPSHYFQNAGECCRNGNGGNAVKLSIWFFLFLFSYFIYYNPAYHQDVTLKAFS